MRAAKAQRKRMLKSQRLSKGQTLSIHRACRALQIPPRGVVFLQTVREDLSQGSFLLVVKTLERIAWLMNLILLALHLKFKEACFRRRALVNSYSKP